MKDQRYMRLTIAERRAIEQGLRARISLRCIATSLGRGTSTISREIVRNSVHRKVGGSDWVEFNDCAKREICNKSRICSNEECTRSFCCGCKFCFHVCSDYIRERCRLTELPPYTCNGCKQRSKCSLEKVLYKAGVAQKSAEEVLRDTRRGVDITEEERKRLDGIVSPLIKKGQSPYHILVNNKDDLMISEKTLYTYIAAGLFSATSMDLRCKVKMKPRKAEKTIRIDRACMIGRTREDFMKLMDENPDTPFVEMDTVIGKKGKGEKVLLTIHFPKPEFMLAFIRDANTARSVSKIFRSLRKALGHEVFSRIFPVVTTDRGSEFTDPIAIEQDGKDRIWTRLYYCDPYSSYQKPYIENGHRMLRMISPKGKSMNDLTQEKVNLMMSHINSYARKALAGRAPIDVFADMYGLEVIIKLGIRKINPNDIVLNPSLIN
jgi:IS30 family transposase